MRVSVMDHDHAPHTSAERQEPTQSLARQCRCGTHTPGGNVCPACRAAPTANAAVQATLNTPGQPLDGRTQHELAPLFAQSFSNLPTRTPPAADLRPGPSDSPYEAAADHTAARALTSRPTRRTTPAFDQVRVHTDASAAASARALDAAAYTVGSHIVFGAGAYTPHTPAGRALLAHELAHVDHQARNPALHGTIQRRGPSIGGFFNNLGRAIADLFGDEPAYDRATLLAYLRVIDEAGDIEDDFDSDNKARAIAMLWAGGDTGFVLSPRRKALLIRELLSGYTGADDEQAILELLERSEPHELQFIFGQGGVAPARLDDNFSGAQQRSLHAFFDRRFRGGTAALLAGRIEPMGRAIAPGRALSLGAAPEDATGDQIRGEPCTVRTPELCHSFESWISLFTALPTFQARSGHRVIGPAAAPEATATDPNAPAAERRPSVLHGAPYLDTDRFIDGPTDTWVRANLPANLVETAYQLPADCADMAVILRHVWLVAHNRTELYQGWVCGIGARRNDPRSAEVRDLIRNQVYSGNVERIVRPYQGAGGQPLRDLDRLAPLLSPGDVLVWEHQDARGNRTGGHTQTVMAVQRSATGALERIQVLQGNQPISRTQAEAFRATEQAAGREAPSVADLRAAPGRRIEASALSGDRLANGPGDVWTWPDGTVLVAAGPPATGYTPAARRRRGAAAPRLSDWAADLRTAPDLSALQSQFEAALLEARTALSGGQAPDAADGRAIGTAAGSRLWELATTLARGRQRGLSAADLGEESHYRPLQHMLGMVAAFQRRAATAGGQAFFAAAATALEPAARGTTSIGFQRGAPPAGYRSMNVLLTGFDPFAFRNGRQVAPPLGAVNPSGAAVLQLDGRRIDDSQSRVAANVEGAVLPVSYAAFRSGAVEGMLQPLAGQVDAVITVSLDPGIAPTEDVQLEQFAVGVHNLNNGVVEPVPALSQGASPGPGMLEAQGDVAGIAQAAGIAPDRVDTAVTFDFIDVTEADRALRALGLAPQAQRVVTIRDVTALRRIGSTMERSAQGNGITFSSSDGQTFQALLLRGPGGSFLSNEVSYRVLRWLGGQAGGSAATSFHVHTPRATAAVGGTIPQGERTPTERTARSQAIGTARDVVNRLVGRLESLIRAIARRFQRP